MAKKKRNLEFSAHNQVSFNVYEGDDMDLDDDSPYFLLEFTDDPREFASRLREAAKWLEENANAPRIIAEID